MVMKHKCVYCNQVINSEKEEIPVKHRYAHVTCFNVAMKTTAQEKAKVQVEHKKNKTTKTQTKPVKEVKDGLTEDEYAEKQAFFALLTQLTGAPITAKQRAVTDRYLKNEYNFSYSGMTQALEWFFVMQGKEVKGDIVGLIPYIYEEAQHYRAGVQRAIEANQSCNMGTMYKTKTMPYVPRNKMVRTIDISLIGESECKD